MGETSQGSSWHRPPEAWELVVKSGPAGRAAEAAAAALGPREGGSKLEELAHLIDGIVPATEGRTGRLAERMSAGAKICPKLTAKGSRRS